MIYDFTVDGHWLEWSSWSTCSQTCDNGTILRTRMCNRTEGGLPCSGESSETLHCFIKSCPVNGGWTTWTDWSGCSVTCGAGLERRSRDCSNPPPGPGGKDCVGNNDDMKICMETICYDGTWMSWSTWSTCTASCQGGISIRKRQCNTTFPSLGHNCVGQNEEYIACNTQICADSVIDGMWSLWSSWTACSSHCLTERTRMCTNPSPSMYGKNCLGALKETKYCNLEYCSHSVRLVNGSDPYEGRLEVFHRGQWGTVCDNSFNDYSAMVVCRMLNYAGIATAHPSAAYGEGTLPILLSKVDCDGDEHDVFECDQLEWGSQQCTHANDVSVSCHPSLNVSLVNGTNMYNGNVLVSVGGGKWHTLCGSFEVTTAKVVCRMLGLPTFMSVPTFFESPDQESRSKYYVIDFLCTGSEHSLTDCNAVSANDYKCRNYDNNGVACGTDSNLCAVNTLPTCMGRDNTYVSYDGCYETMIYHIILPVECIDFLVHCEIADDCCLHVSRHRPVLCCIDIVLSNGESQVADCGINWGKHNPALTEQYQSLLAADEGLLEMSVSVLNKRDIDVAYRTICERLVSGVDSIFPLKKKTV
ncbi:hypothetical protein ACF0H5_016801 [Mactra antiquata]